MPVPFTPEAVLRSVRADSVDLDLSQIIFKEDEPVGAGLVSRRGRASRLSGMGIVPNGRRQGAGHALVTHLIEMAAARGDQNLALEVIESNGPAVSLYRQLGFQTIRRLISMKREAALEATRAQDGPRPEEIDPRHVADRINLWGFADLPWQSSGETLSHVHPPALAYRLGDAYGIISDPSQARVALRAIVVDPQRRRQGEATRLLTGLFAAHPAKEWVVPAICPEEFLPLLEASHFELEPLSQLQMVRHISMVGQP